MLLATIVININPIAFSVGPLSVHWYGIMYIVGISIGLLVAWPYARSKGITKEQLITIVSWCLPAGLIGARLYYVIQQPLGPYLSQPWRILAFWEGGMAFYGAIFAVMLTLWLVARDLGISLYDLLDVGSLFASVGQFFGRIGNLINGDIIGYPTSLPWGVMYTNPNSFAPRSDIAYQPASVYEAMFNVVLFAILWSIRKKVKPGVLCFIYIIGYSIGQIIVFFFRDNVVVFWGLKQAQLTAIAVMLVATAIFLLLVRRERSGARASGQGQA